MKQLSKVLLIIMVIIGCSRGDVVRMARIAATGDIADVQQMATDKAVRYATDPKSLERDIKQFAKVVEQFKTAVSAVWGPKEVKAPKPKEYVKYTQNYLSRALVDFDQGIITVETLDPKDPLNSLKNAIVTTLLTPDDPRAVDLYSDKMIKLGERPFLLNEVRDQEGKDIRWGWRAERFADYLIKKRLQIRPVGTGRHIKTVNYVKIMMVKDHHQIRAGKYKPLVEHNAKRFSISKNLVYAIIKTESDFNPYAVSHAPAFGLMQIVPTTAGRDVHEFLNKKSGLPSKKFLFTPENNIEYGAAYLHLLYYKYLNAIQDPVSREYCVIAAYNTGSGNVLRTFDKNQKRAPQKINNLGPLEVFSTLRTNLPHDETRRYLTKVMDAKKSFVNF